MLVASHGGTAALLCGAPVITSHSKTRRGTQQHHGDLVMLSQLHKPNEKLRRAPATAWWRGGENMAAWVTVFYAGETTNSSNTIT